MTKEIEILQNTIDFLTRVLKDYTGDDNGYARTWAERVELKAKLAKLTKQTK